MVWPPAVLTVSVSAVTDTTVPLIVRPAPPRSRHDPSPLRRWRAARSCRRGPELPVRPFPDRRGGGGGPSDGERDATDGDGAREGEDEVEAAPARKVLRATGGRRRGKTGWRR